MGRTVGSTPFRGLNRIPIGIVMMMNNPLKSEVNYQHGVMFTIIEPVVRRYYPIRKNIGLREQNGQWSQSIALPEHICCLSVQELGSFLPPEI